MTLPGEPEFTDNLPILRRSAVRVVVVDCHGTVLLFHTSDRFHPDLGRWWELPGGGIDAGETYREAAVRELREETGIAITPSQVGPPTWRRAASFRHRGGRNVQDEVIVAVRLAVPGPEVDESQRLEYERENYFGFRWWPVAEVARAAAGPGRQRFYPGRLPEFLGRFLAGHEIDEPFELWS
jgi:8-oxo-dGTP pyrophosphatase MutT (NUDIX family)